MGWKCLVFHLGLSLSVGLSAPLFPNPRTRRTDCTRLPDRNQLTLQQNSQEGDSSQKSHIVLHGASHQQSQLEGSYQPVCCLELAQERKNLSTHPTPSQ